MAGAVSSVAHVLAILFAVVYLRESHEKAWEPFWIPVAAPFVAALTSKYRLVHLGLIAAAVSASVYYWYGCDQGDHSYTHMLSVFSAVIAL